MILWFWLSFILLLLYLFAFFGFLKWLEKQTKGYLKKRWTFLQFKKRFLKKEEEEEEDKKDFDKVAMTQDQLY